MPKKSNRSKVIDSIFLNAAVDLANLHSGDESEEENIHFNLMEDVEMALQFKCGFINKVPKQKLWLDDVLPNYDENRFKQSIRIPYDDYQMVLELILLDPIFETSRAQFPVYVQLAVALYRFGIYGTGASIPAVSRIFGVGDGSSIVRFTRRVILAILRLKDRFIYWPDEAERQQIVVTNYETLPRCIGFIDGVHIPLEEAPTLDKDSYYDKDKKYSIQVQLICDHNKTIRNMVAGYTGSNHDSRVWNDCDLSKNPGNYFSDEQWIAGDKGYPLSRHLITPFRENSKEAPERGRREFNRYFSSQRVKIEHVNGILKETFSSLKELRIRIKDKESHERAVDWIGACLIIYNIIKPKLSVIPAPSDINETEEGDDEDYEDGFSASDKRMSLYYFVQNKLN